MPEPPDPTLKSLYDAAGDLGISLRFLTSLIADGEIESVKLGSRRLVPSDAIADYIEKKRAK